MNNEKVKRVLQAYLEKFDVLNNAEHREYYKWEAFKHFEENWDIEADNFAEMFKESMRLTSNLINNSQVNPTEGIVKLAENPELTEGVREAFRELYREDHGDIAKRQSKIEDFRDKINGLLDKYEPGKWKYTQEFRAGLFYLAMRYPKENYLYKSTEAREFMYCVEYGDDFGRGINFNLLKYYRMCDELVEEIKRTPELVKKHNERLTDSMLTDDDFHLLAFDIIYCAIAYGLYVGMEIKRPVKKQSAKERNSEREKQLQSELEEKEEELRQLLVQKSDIRDISIVGLKVRHKKYGEGIVISKNEDKINVRFECGEKKLSLSSAFSLGLLVCSEAEVVDFLVQHDTCNKQIEQMEKNIRGIRSDLKSLKY